jgi:hypothetical protein
MTADDKRSYTTEREGLACRIVTGGIVIDDGPPPPVEDEKLNLWLNMINAKLDYLIRLSPSGQEGVVYTELEPLNISGGGMSLVTKEHFTLGEMVEIKIVIRIYPPKILYLYGNIVRIEAMPDRAGVYTLGIKFSWMRDDIRDEILKFDFKGHRQKMMARKFESNGPSSSDAVG